MKQSLSNVIAIRFFTFHFSRVLKQDNIGRFQLRENAFPPQESVDFSHFLCPNIWKFQLFFIYLQYRKEIENVINQYS